MTLAGKTLIVTGGNRGLGLELCKMALQKGAKKIIMGCRDLTAGGWYVAHCPGPRHGA
jgi:NAD(P)-dependent dehydrogenase (short-subunit alcohol dehydrogenase family)